MRVKKNENKRIVNFLSSNARDITEDWYPLRKSLERLKSFGIEISKDTPIKIRIVKVPLDTGETEVLVTNLYDTETYDVKSLKEAYHLRWGIETIYSTLKEKIQLAQFSGIRQICVEQDFFANLFLHNLQSLIEKQVEPYLERINNRRKYHYKVNRNMALGIAKVHIVKLFISNNSQHILSDLEKLFGNYLEPIRPGRKFPRKKRRILHGKFYTLTNYKRVL